MVAHEPAPPGSRQRQRENGTWVLVVPDEYWMSEAETHRLVGGTRLRLVHAVRNGRIVQVENAARTPGYLLATVQREAQWWAQAPRWRSLLRQVWENS